MSRELEAKLRQTVDELLESTNNSNVVTQILLTLELFNCVIVTPSAVINLRNSVLDLTDHIKDDPLTIWLKVIDIGVPKELSIILLDFQDGWRNLKMLPTGCMVKTKRKKGHFTFQQIREIKHINLLARRFCLMMGISSVTLENNPIFAPSIDHSKWTTAVNDLNSDDFICCAYSSLSILGELKRNEILKVDLAKVLIIKVIQLLVNKVNEFVQIGNKLLIAKKCSVLLLANRKHFEHCFGQELLKVAKVEDEMQLDFALEHYLSMEENAPLLKAFNERDEARKQHENTKSELDSLSSIVATLFASVRCLAMVSGVCLSLIMDLPGQRNPTSSLESFKDPEVAGKKLNDKNNKNNKNSDTSITFKKLEDILLKLPWSRFRAIAFAERRVCLSASLVTLFATVSARFSCSIQELVMQYFGYDSFKELGSDPGHSWYDVTIPPDAPVDVPEIEPGPVSLDEILSPIAGVVRFSLAAAINTSCVYWTLRYHDPVVVETLLRLRSEETPELLSLYATSNSNRLTGAGPGTVSSLCKSGEQYKDNNDGNNENAKTTTISPIKDNNSKDKSKVKSLDGCEDGWRDNPLKETTLDDCCWIQMLHKADERSRLILTKEDYEDHHEYFEHWEETQGMDGENRAVSMSDEYFDGKLEFNSEMKLDELLGNVPSGSITEAVEWLAELDIAAARPWLDDEWLIREEKRLKKKAKIAANRGKLQSKSDTDDDDDSESDSEAEAAEIEAHRKRNEDSIFNKDKEKVEVVDDEFKLSMEWFLYVLQMGAGHLSNDEKIDVDYTSLPLVSEGVFVSQFVHLETERFARELLDEFAYGPGRVNHLRFSHPLQILVMLISMDTSNTITKYLHDDPRSRLAPIVDILLASRSNSSHSVNPFDTATASAACEMLTAAFSGCRAPLDYPSLATQHEHLIIDPVLPMDSTFSMFKKDLRKILLPMAGEYIYRPCPNTLCAAGLDGSPRLVRLLRLLTAISVFKGGPEFVVSILEEASPATPMQIAFHNLTCRWEELEAKEWLAPFILCIRGGTVALAHHLIEKKQWEDQLHYAQDMWLDIKRCSSMIQVNFGALLAVLTGSVRSLSEHIAEQNKPWADAFLLCLEDGDFDVSRNIFRCSLNIVTNAQRVNFTLDDGSPDPRFAKEVPFDSHVNLFRAALARRGQALSAAFTVLDSASQLLQEGIGVSQEWVNDPNAAERPTEEAQILAEQKARDDAIAIAAASTYTDDDGNLINPKPLPTRKQLQERIPKKLKDTIKLLPPPTPFHVPEDDDGPSPMKEKEHKLRERSNKKAVTGGIVTPPQERKPFSLTAWQCQRLFEQCVRGVDVALIALEFVTEWCEGRLELQRVVTDRSPGAFIQTPSLLARLRLSDQGKFLGNFFGNRYFVISGFHPGLAACVVRMVRAMVRRYMDGRRLVCASGVVEAMMDCLTQSINRGDEYLISQIVLTVEQMIIRNQETWQYVKATGGTGGLLRLMKKGNASLKILACAAIGSDVQRPGLDGQFFLQDVVHKGVVDILRELILSTNHDVQNSALSLSLLVLTSTIARTQALERPFLCAIAQALRCHDVSVMQSACRVLLLLGSENQAELRQKMFDVTATRSPNKDTNVDEDLSIITTTLNTITDEDDGSAKTDMDSAYLATTVERLVDLVAGKVVSVQEPDVS